MKKHSAHGSIYTMSDGGVLVKTGNDSRFTGEDYSSYLAVKQQGKDIDRLYRENGLIINPRSGLAKLIRDAADLSDLWLCNKQQEIKTSHLLSAAQLARIANAAIPLGVSNKARALLMDLKSGTLDLQNRDQSKAKDTLWELELWRLFLSLGMTASLEEPDIVLSFEGERVGLACKKLYSERNVPSVISNAVLQIEKSSDYGMVAINVDDLMPKGYLRFASKKAAMTFVADFNSRFIERHQECFRRYLIPDRVMAALVSVSVMAYVRTANHAFYNARQSTIWHLPSRPKEKARQFGNFFNAIKAGFS